MTIFDLSKVAEERHLPRGKFGVGDTEKQRGSIRITKRKTGQLLKGGAPRYSLYISIGGKIIEETGWLKGDKINIVVNTETNTWTLVRTSSVGWVLEKIVNRLYMALTWYEGTIEIPTALVAYHEDMEISPTQIILRPQSERINE